MKRVLIIDALNLFVRSYVVDPSLSTNGDPIGGLKGFIKSLQKFARETRPDFIVVAWDGPGGSIKRKQQVKGYKDGRAPIRLNRSVRAMSEQQESENKAWQQIRLFDYLNQTPVVQLMFDSVEADDLIAYTVKSEHFDGWQKVIVSSDKDFYQLADDHTIILRPIQKEIKTKDTIVEEFGIHPNNFALARAMSGDKSDNLPGLDSVGLKTIAKRFPFLKEEKEYTIDDLIEVSLEVEKPLKIHESIIEGKDIVATNHKMMQLSSPSLSHQDIKTINHIFENADLNFNHTNFQKMMLQDGFGEVNFNELFAMFKRILYNNKDA